MKAIKTKYLAPTNTKGARIQASIKDGNGKTTRKTYPYRYELDNEALHIQIAHEFAKYLKWYESDKIEFEQGWYNGDCYHVVKP